MGMERTPRDSVWKTSAPQSYGGRTAREKTLPVITASAPSASSRWRRRAASEGVVSAGASPALSAGLASIVVLMSPAPRGTR
jgi:hypothetical protein